jgi:hypothetical protein
MWKDMEEAGRPQTIKFSARALHATRATDICSEFVIVIASHGNNGYTSMPQCFIYTYVACLVFG